MGYDFHTIGTHPGPTTPLGWIDSVATSAQNTGHPEKFILGLPNYGVTSSDACPLATCQSRCSGPVATTTDHMQSCPFGNWNAGRSLNCDTGNGMQFWDDAQSLEEKVKSAQAHALGGITYWNVGGEAPGWFEMVQKYY
jgi:spore germination protein YaaH